MKRNFKRILVTSDWHCGHQVGLSPEKYHAPTADDHKFKKLSNVRSEIWKWFAQTVDKIKPVDVLIINGDALDGKGDKYGGTEQITPDRKVQCDIAMDVIEYIDPSVIRMTYGTSYHVSANGEEWEDIIADKAGAKIGSHEWYEVNGVVIDCKHKIVSSQIPHGRLTALAREILWAKMWNARNQQPEPDILIRSHVHYFEHVKHDGCLGFITPALQGFGSKYGARQCSGTVDIGFLVIDIYNDGEIKWKEYIANTGTTETKAEKLY